MLFAEPGEWTDPIRNAAERFLESLLDHGAFEFPGATVGGREFREDLYDSFFVVFNVQGRQVGLMHEDPIIDRGPGNSDLFQVQAIQDVG
jgi:hypothetical protein